ncbi:NAD(P)H-quinone oxidoreductase [Acinetobacter sp. V91_7]|uniref:NAD(P)H-quinone oxidoreductase n=1 Tax=Acinetobacter TaxID=469 RepID=UPI00287DF2E0|nr:MULTISPECIES: NAD(P)H-quinone oxidoreductase [unclassified Acinetobacter]MDS7929642.1 NAD(P)H-quinone oxidoreductase [Acinetobacter sp. V102_4]MDS7933181.1 NAD(P)H-quinone oxidoreductase [Acinetobacter sp. V91_4B]MDS7963406.1 NAD(P)H-quinone oxidoreductase [Acinetobacter sp. V91_7]MDS8027435.1 NAD(P)H-quinone oxidoreductase [Acinetobacter sp. V91_13]
MKCITFNGAGGPEVITVSERAMPEMTEDGILIEVVAAGINGPDVMQRQGLYAPPPGVTDIPGLEVSGIVKQVGKQVTKFKAGDEVCALVQGGGYAEYVVAHQDNVLFIPEGLTLIEGGILLETFMTVWSHLFQHAKFRPNSSILIHGGTSGIGTTATMLTRAFGATQIFTTVSSKEHQEASLKIGADVAINYNEDDFVEVVKKHTDGKGVDFVLDIIAGDYIQRNYDVAAMNGVILQIGVLKGLADKVNIFPMLAKRLTHTGATLRSQSAEAKAEVMAALQEKVWPLISKGQLKPLLYKTFDLEEARQAHELLQKGEHVGKLALIVKK